MMNAVIDCAGIRKTQSVYKHMDGKWGMGCVAKLPRMMQSCHFLDLRSLFAFSRSFP